MKKISVFSVLLGIAALMVVPSGALAWNSGVHVLMAQELTGCDSPDLAWGSIVPDMILYGSDPSQWPTGFWDTHYEYLDLSDAAAGWVQEPFALGWLSHNELFGSDYYAHIYFPLDVNPYDGPGSTDGYIIQKAAALSLLTGVDEMVAHFAVEAALDLLVADTYVPDLGWQLFDAAAYRTRRDLGLLMRVLVVEGQVVDARTLLDAETRFRDLISNYGLALAQPAPQNLAAVSQLGAELAEFLFGQPFSAVEVQQLLEVAMAICPDYWAAIEITIGEME